MNIFFTCSYEGKAQYQRYYDLIIDSIKKTGAVISSPETDVSFPPPDKYPHYQKIRQGILAADAVIFEVSHPGLQLGYETALAVLSKKHVLCLSLHEDYSQKITHPYFHAARYSELNLDDKISEFINSLRHHQYTERFNFFLSPQQLKSLDHNASKSGQTRSDYLRSLIDQNS